MKKILLTDSSYKHTVAIAKYLKKELSCKIYVLGNTKRKYSCYYDFIYTFDITNGDVKEIIDLDNEVKFDAIIPVGANSCSFFINNDFYFSDKILQPSKEKFEIAMSKESTYQVANSIGVKIPKTIIVTKKKELDTVNLNFPIVIKGKYEVGKNVVEYAYNRTELKQKFDKICYENSYECVNDWPMLQEYIEGDGCAFFGLYIDGKCEQSFQHKRLREYPPTGGASSSAMSFYDKNVEIYGKKILDFLEWNGVVMVEFKYNSKNEPILMEINPKFWGSTELSLYCGVNFPLQIIKKLSNSSFDIKDYSKNIIFSWPFNGDILHALKGKRNFVKVLKATFAFKSNNIDFRDFRFLFYSVFSTIKSIIKK